MKKILLLTLFIPLVFACSSDDSSDNSNQTFLEKFDGKVFQREMPITEYPIGQIVDVHGYVKFENSSKFLSTANFNSTSSQEIEYCAKYGQGINDFRGLPYNDNGGLSTVLHNITIQENTKDRLKIFWTKDFEDITDGDGNSLTPEPVSGTFIFEVEDGKITEIFRNDIGESFVVAFLEESLTDFNSFCTSYVLSD